MDLKSFAETYWSMQEGKVNPGLQAYLDKKKGKKDNGDEKEEENGKESKGSKPDFLDLDKDGDKKEPMKKAAKEKKEETEHNYVNAYLEGMSVLVPKSGANVRRRDKGEQLSQDEYVVGKKSETNKVAEHHQKDADGKVIEHDDTTPSSVEEEKTVLEQLAENGREIDSFEAVISYLIDEGFAKSWEEAQDIMTTLKPELVEEVYQNQLKKLSK